MKIRSEELEQAGYVLLDEFGHNQPAPFIKLYLSKHTFSTIFFNSINFIFVIAVIALAYFYKVSIHLSISIILLHVLYGIGLVVLLIPLHEFIHGLAYKTQGAKRTSYFINLRKFYFLAIADKFVANRKEFTIVALSPFLIITLLLLALLFFVNPHWQLTVLSAIASHSICCTGDFGLLSYFNFHKNKELITFDDKENKTTFFYYRNKSSV